MIVIDEQQISSRDFVTRHISEVAAESGALLRGVQFVELVLMPEAEMIALHASGVRPTE